MPTNEVVAMILEALQTMAIGVPGVFVVLAVFYCALKLMMARMGNDDKSWHVRWRVRPGYRDQFCPA